MRHVQIRLASHLNAVGATALLLAALSAIGGCANDETAPPNNTPADNCIDITQAYCDDVGLAPDACIDLIAQTCSEGPTDPVDPPPPVDPSNPGNAQCIADFVAQCTQFGVDEATCTGYAEQYCEATNPTDPTDPTDPSACEAQATAQCEQFGLDPASCAALVEQICGALGGGGLPGGGGGGGGSDPLCLIDTIAQCTQWGLDLATCAALAGPVCENLGGLPDLGDLGGLGGLGGGSGSLEDLLAGLGL